MTVRWEEIEPGAEPPEWTPEPVSQTDIVRYQGASGDFNPVHHDVAFATNAGYPPPLTVGMYTAGLMNTWATNWLGPENIRRTRVRWKRPVFPGDTITFCGAVVKKYSEDDLRKVDLELTGVNQDGYSVIQGWVTFVVPTEETS